MKRRFILRLVDGGGKGLHEREIVFSHWTRWNERTLLEGIRHPGVYVLAHFGAAPPGRANPQAEQTEWIRKSARCSFGTLSASWSGGLAGSGARRRSAIAGRAVTDTTTLLADAQIPSFPFFLKTGSAITTCCSAYVNWERYSAFLAVAVLLALYVKPSHLIRHLG